MDVRNATPEDLPVIVRIYNSTIPGRLVTADLDFVTVDEKQSWFAEHNEFTRPLWIVEDAGNIIGWVSFQDFYGRPAYAGTAEISIYLDEASRGKGYGKRVLQYSIEKSASLGIKRLLGFIFAHNFASLKLFEACGFAEWGHLHEIALLDDKPASLKILGRIV